MASAQPHSAKGRASGALAKPVRLDEVLAALVGPGPLPRSQIIKKSLAVHPSARAAGRSEPAQH